MMNKLPELDDVAVEKEFAAGHDKLARTEDILKRLLINIEAFKKIEHENNRLKSMIVEQQESLKKDYKTKLDELSYLVTEKEKIASKSQETLVARFKEVVGKLDRIILHEKKKNLALENKYKEMSALASKIDMENKKLRLILMKNQENLKKEIKGKVKDFVEKTKALHLETHDKHKDFIRQHETIKLELKKDLAVQQERYENLEKKYASLLKASDSLFKENKDLKMTNKQLLLKMKEMEKSSITNKEELEKRAERIRAAFEEKLKESLKEQLEKEVTFKAEMASLKKDLARYYEENRDLKESYMKREKELKEKIKSLDVLFDKH